MMYDCEWCSVFALPRPVPQRLGSGSILRSRSGFLGVLRVMAATPELALHVVPVDVEDVSVRAETSQLQELVVGNVFNYKAEVTGKVFAVYDSDIPTT